MNHSDKIRDLILQHPAILKAGRVGFPGFSLPHFDSPEIIILSEENREALLKRGISYSGKELNPSHIVLEVGDSTQNTLRISLGGVGGNTVVIGPKCRIHRGVIEFQSGGGHLIACAGLSHKIIGFHLYLRGDQCAFFTGTGNALFSVTGWIEGSNESIHIGDDCLSSWNTWMRLADGHALIDLETRSLIDSGGSIVVGPHVWIGQDVMILTDVQIGAGSVLGARALVTRSIPERCVAAGLPAKVVRTNVSWTRSAKPSAEEISKILLDLDNYSLN